MLTGPDAAGERAAAKSIGEGKVDSICGLWPRNEEESLGTQANAGFQMSVRMIQSLVSKAGSLDPTYEAAIQS